MSDNNTDNNHSTSNAAPKSGPDIPKLVVLGAIAAFVLFSAYKLFGNRSAAPAAPAAASAAAPAAAEAKKFFSFEQLETVGNKAAANALFPDPIIAKSCPLTKCKSVVAINSEEKQPVPKRGLNIYAVMADKQLVLVKTLDHCSDQKAFQTDSLMKLVEHARESKVMFLVGEDTVNCEFNTGKMEGIENWTQGFTFEKLHKLGTRNTFFAVIDPKAKTVVWEAASGDTITFDSAKPN